MTGRFEEAPDDHERMREVIDSWLEIVGLPYVIRAVVTVGTALHLVTHGIHRIARCAATTCDRVVVDVTRNGRQRYCSVRCSNRSAVRRHRARTRSL